MLFDYIIKYSINIVAFIEIFFIYLMLLINGYLEKYEDRLREL
jgi:hypothetical protein